MRPANIFLTAAALLAAAGCSSGDSKQAPKEAQQARVRTVAVEARPMVERMDLTGSIEPTRLARMASPVEGPVAECPVREGDRVRAGQLFARLGRAAGDDATAASARADLEREQQELERIERLVESGALPGEELDRALVRVSEARARLARADEKLGDYRVTAPWTGVVSRVNVAVGDFVPARSTLVEIFDPASLVLRFAVSEESAARVSAGARVAVTLDAHPGWNFTAKVVRIFPEIDRATHTRTVEAEVDGKAALAPGMFARLSLTLFEAPEALAVPTEAVVERGGKKVVFVIAEDGTAAQRTVEIGIEEGGMVQLLSGATAGERVAFAGHTRLKDGQKVIVMGQPDGTQPGPKTGGVPR